jgi:hypothetical protein
MVFLLLLVVTGVLSALAVKSKRDRRAKDQSPQPVFSLAILVLTSLLFVALILGWLKI